MTRKAPELSTFARRVLARTEALACTREQLARRAGISLAALNKLLRSGATPKAGMPSVPTLMALAGALKVHPYWLTEALMVDARVSLHLQALMHGDRGGFVEDRSCPDGCVVAPGAHFYKTWVVQNLGAGVWERRKVMCWDHQIRAIAFAHDTQGAADKVEPVSWLTPDVQELQPEALGMVEGAVLVVTVGFTAPTTPGVAMSYWVFAHEDGSLCYDESAGMQVKVHVDPNPAHWTVFPAALGAEGYRPEVVGLSFE
ncbi:MAG: hypothetical protein RJA98_3996 [Pseudomonadota bacterium]